MEITLPPQVMNRLWEIRNCCISVCRKIELEHPLHNLTKEMEWVIEHLDVILFEALKQGAKVPNYDT